MAYGLHAHIPAARQLGVHGHVTINGKRLDRPSYHVKPGDEISIRNKSQKKTFLAEVVEASAGLPRPSWLEFDPAEAPGTLTSVPDRADLPFSSTKQPSSVLLPEALS